MVSIVLLQSRNSFGFFKLNSYLPVLINHTCKGKIHRCVTLTDTNLFLAGEALSVQAKDRIGGNEHGDGDEHLMFH